MERRHAAWPHSLQACAPAPHAWRLCRKHRPLERNMRAWLMVSAVIWASGCSTDPYTQFAREFESGADCPRLFELRNDAKQGASPARQEEMNTRLRSVQCFSSTSKRAAAGPSNTASFTIQQYRIYREVISSPMSIPEPEAFDNVARKHGVPSSVAHDAVNRVQESLFKNGWFASPDAEIRHASDWAGETQ
jgi:hypothetical protein